MGDILVVDPSVGDSQWCVLICMASCVFGVVFFVCFCAFAALCADFFFFNERNRQSIKRRARKREITGETKAQLLVKHTTPSHDRERDCCKPELFFVHRMYAREEIAWNETLFVMQLY